MCIRDRASLAPWSLSILAMPQAIEWSLATPMIRPRFPSINPGMVQLPNSFVKMRSGVDVLEYDRSIGAAEAKRVRQHGADLNVVLALAQDGHVGESRIDGFDVGALAE